MKIFVSIDDTDNIESRGTGELAALLADDLQREGWGKASYITRHQLLVHPDVPYTSHNSSMCFRADIDEACLDDFISHAEKFLEEESAEGSDPGLCVAVPERLERPQDVVDFGVKAKSVVLSRQDAYNVAERSGIHLSAHGGTGDGVIGALAGAGLRMGGNDGRLRGRLHVGEENSVCSVGEICAHPHIDEVRVLDGTVLTPDEKIILGETVKAVLLDGKSVLLVMPEKKAAVSASWRTCPKQLVKRY